MVKLSSTENSVMAGIYRLFSIPRGILAHSNLKTANPELMTSCFFSQTHLKTVGWVKRRLDGRNSCHGDKPR